MNRVYISVGSNQDTVRHVRSALDALHQRFGDLAISSVYESEAVGFDGENFLNLVVGLDTDEPLASLADWLKAVEDSNGRQRNVTRYSSRTLDLDILIYGDQVGQPEGVELPRRGNPEKRLCAEAPGRDCAGRAASHGAAFLWRPVERLQPGPASLGHPV